MRQKTTAQSYLLGSGLSATYWGKKIIAAEGRGRFTESNIDQANGWVTCACGKSTSDILRSFTGRPMDSYLGKLGEDFSEFVHGGEIYEAAKTLALIEKRATAVAKESLQEKQL